MWRPETRLILPRDKGPAEKAARMVKFLLIGGSSRRILLPIKYVLHMHRSSSTFLPTTRLLEFNLGEPQRSGRPYGHMENLYRFQVGRDMFLNQSWAIIIHKKWYHVDNSCACQIGHLPHNIVYCMYLLHQAYDQAYDRVHAPVLPLHFQNFQAPNIDRTKISQTLFA